MHCFMSHHPRTQMFFAFKRQASQFTVLLFSLAPWIFSSQTCHLWWPEEQVFSAKIFWRQTSMCPHQGAEYPGHIHPLTHIIVLGSTLNLEKSSHIPKLRLVSLTGAVTVVSLGLLELKNFSKWVISLWLNPHDHWQRQNSAIRPQSPTGSTESKGRQRGLQDPDFHWSSSTGGWNTLTSFSPNRSVGPYGQKDLADRSQFTCSCGFGPLD